MVTEVKGSHGTSAWGGKQIEEVQRSRVTATPADEWSWPNSSLQRSSVCEMQTPSNAGKPYWLGEEIQKGPERLG